MMRGIAALLIVVGGWMLFSKFIFFELENVDIRETFRHDIVDLVEVHIDSADVRIVRGAGDEIEVALLGKASGKYLSNLKLNATVQGSKLTVKPEITDDHSTFGIHRMSVGVVVTLPDKVWDSVEIQVGSGNLEMSQVHAEVVHASTSSGNAKLHSIEAETIEITLGSGDIRFQDIAAEAMFVSTDSGKTEGSNYRTSKLFFESGSGDVTLTDGTGELTGGVDSGNITVIADSIEQDMKLETGSGNITVQLAGTSLDYILHGDSSYFHAIALDALSWSSISRSLYFNYKI